MAANAKPGWAQTNGEPVALAGYVQNTWDMSEPESPRRLDHILQGQSITTYTHQKSGTVHALAGPAGAKYIRWDMTATAEYGDSWTLNGEPVVVVYCDGNPILSHSLITGDMLIGAVGTGKVALAIPTPKPNENLLDNWHFVDPINQRGQAEYTEGGYTIDRWILWGTDGTIALQNHTVNLNCAPGQAEAYLEEHMGISDGLQGAEVTFSLLCAGGEGRLSLLHQHTSGYTLLAKKEINADINPHILSATGKMPETTAPGDTLFARITANVPGNSLSLTAAKLEEGPRQTLARQDADGNWVLLDPPPNKATELLKCQRYYQRYVCGDSVALPQFIATTNRALAINVTLPTTMASFPNIIIETATLRNQNTGVETEATWLQTAKWSRDERYVGNVYSDTSQELEPGVPYGFLFSLSAEL